MGITKINVQAYANDVVISCTTVASLEKLMNKFSEGTESHELVVNDKKTIVLVFGCYSSFTFSLNDHITEIVTQYKYLGIELTKNLTITEDVGTVQSAFNSGALMLTRKFHSVRMDIKKKLFDSSVLHRWNYATM